MVRMSAAMTERQVEKRMILFRLDLESTYYVAKLLLKVSLSMSFSIKKHLLLN